MSDEQPVEVQTPVEAPVAQEAPVAVEATPAVTKWVNDDGTFNRDAFPDDLGKHSSFDKWGNVEEYVKGAINQSKFVGQKAEEWFNSDDPDVKVRRAEILGIPDTADDYEVLYPNTFADLPDDSQAAIKDYFSESATWALENGVPKEIFEKFASRDLERAISVRETQLAEQENSLGEAVDALKTEWRGEKYAENVEKSDNMAKFLGMEDLIPYMEADPNLRKSFFDGASKITSDDTIIEARQQETMSTLSEQLDDIDDKMIAYDGPTTDRAYQRMLDKKVAMLAKLN